MSFELVYHAGENFDTSYFVGREGADLKVVRASFVVPADVQEEVVKVETAGKDHPEIIAPEEAVEQIKAACGNTMEGFKKWADEIKGIAKAASLVKKADAPTYSFSEKEVAKVQLPKDGEVIISQNMKEAEAGKEMGLTKSKATKVKQFYNRLPKTGPGEADKTINLSSAVHEKYQLALQALADMTEKNESLNKEKDELVKGKETVEKEFGKVKDELDVDKKKGEIDAILVAIKKGSKLDPEAEKTVVDTLSPLDQNVLKAISKVIAAIFAAKTEPKAPAMNPFEPKKPVGAPGLPGVNPFEPKKASMPGVDLPQMGGSVGMENSVTLIDSVSTFFDHN